MSSNRKKPTYRGKAFKKSVAAIAKTVLDKSSETKVFAQASQDNVSSTASILHMCTIANGDGPSNKQGSVIDPIALHLNYTLIHGDSTNLVRVIIFRWLPNNATAPLASDILYTTSSPYEFLKIQGRTEFNVLYDKLHTLSQCGTPNRSIGTTIPLRALIKYDGISSSVGNGHIYMLTLSDSLAAVHPQMNWVSRLTFKDP